MGIEMREGAGEGKRNRERVAKKRDTLPIRKWATNLIQYEKKNPREIFVFDGLETSLEHQFLPNLDKSLALMR